MKHSFNKRNHKAFSLTEVLLVVGLFSVLSISVYQTFANGLKIWDYGTKYFAEEDVFIFLERISEDLQNTLKHSSIQFKGKDSSVEFATMVTVPKDSRSIYKGAYVRQIGKISYFFDSGEQMIMVKKANYAKAIKSKYFKPQRIAAYIKSLKLQYYYKTDEGLKIKDEAKEAIPCMVEVSIDYLSGKENRRAVKLIEVPIGL